MKEELEDLRSQLAAEKERADGNWDAPERIKAKWAAGQTAPSESEELRALVALVMDRLQEAGGTLDDKLRHQIIMDLQQDIRQGGETALAWWNDKLANTQEIARALVAALMALRACAAKYRHCPECDKQIAAALSRAKDAGLVPGQGSALNTTE